jgi:hypothetical protein
VVGVLLVLDDLLVGCWTRSSAVLLWAGLLTPIVSRAAAASMSNPVRGIDASISCETNEP